MSSTLSPNMNLPIATVGNEPGPNYAFDSNAAFTIIDQHDHSSGSGVQITPAGININSALTFGNNLATNLAASVYTSQASQAALQSTYVKGVDLYYRDGNNNEIRLTTGGSIVGTAGSISGLPSGTAGVNFSGGVFTFSASTNTPANIQVGSVLLGNNVALSKYLTLAPPAAMAANFNITLPSLPVSQSILTIDNAGDMATPVVYPISTAGIAALAIGTAQIQALAVTAAKIANNTITTTQISNSAGITGAQIAATTIAGSNMVNSTVTETQLAGRTTMQSASCGVFTTSSVTEVSITSLSQSITTNASKTIWVRLECPTPANAAGGSACSMTGVNGGGGDGFGPIVYLRRNGTLFASWLVTADMLISGISCSLTGVNGTGTYALSVNAQGGSFSISNAVLVLSQL